MDYKDRLLMYLARKVCATLDDLVRDLGLKEGTAMVYLSRLVKEGVVVRKWIKAGDKRHRLYCVNSTTLKELHTG